MVKKNAMLWFAFATILLIFAFVFLILNPVILFIGPGYPVIFGFIALTFYGAAIWKWFIRPPYSDIFLSRNSLNTSWEEIGKSSCKYQGYEGYKFLEDGVTQVDRNNLIKLKKKNPDSRIVRCFDPDRTDG